MVVKCIVFVSLMAVDTFGQGLLSADQYLFGIQKLVPSFDKVNAFDGPPSVSSALITTPVKITKPTTDEMRYYNYYTASINCGLGVKNMECGYCAMIKGDIKHFVGIHKMNAIGSAGLAILGDSIILNNATHDTLALVALSEKRKEIVIAFRATLNIWNCVLDYYVVQTSPHGTDGIKIHRGFYIATMSLYDSVVKTVAAFRLGDKKYAEYKLVLTGHSLGAAMARITYFFLLHLKQFPGIAIEVYTYGEPRCGNKRFADFMNQQNVKTARIVNRADIVPHLPPTSILGTKIIFTDYYYHVQNEYWIDGNKEKFTSRDVYEDPNSANSNAPMYSVLDHFNYFDVNHLQCLSDFPQTFAVPVVFPASAILPPLPQNVQVALRKTADMFDGFASPVFG